MKERPAGDKFNGLSDGTGPSERLLFAFGTTLPQVRRNLDVCDYAPAYIDKIYASLEAMIRGRRAMPALLVFMPEAKQVLTAIATHADWHLWTDKTMPHVLIAHARDLFSDADIRKMVVTREKAGRPVAGLFYLVGRVLPFRPRL